MTMMPGIEYLNTHLGLLILFSFLLGILVGSFLNVVIVRLPKMLLTKWRRDCQEHLQLPVEPPLNVNLFIPRSHCPKCHHPLRVRDNIPLLSFILLRGRCAHCHEKISWLYPSVELLTGLLTVLVFTHYFITWNSSFTLLLTWSLIVLCFIDLRLHLLPDALTLPFLWLGLVLSLFQIFVTPDQSILGAVLGYGILWCTSELFNAFTKKRGMGHGDFKMLAMIGAWFGSLMMLNILLLGVFLALIVSLILLFFKRMTTQDPLPFGSFLAISSWISILTGPFLIQWINHF